MRRVNRRLAFAFLLLAVFACKKEAPLAVDAKNTSKPAEQVRAEPPKAPAAGQAMPAFSAELLGSRGTFDVSKERGNVVMLNLWATWCGPCRFEMPELQALHDKHAGHGFKVVGVSVDEGGAEEVQPFVTEQKITFPIALDPAGKLAGILQTDILPTTILVDRNGQIVWKHIGPLSANDPELIAALDKALKG
jgi:thiol-disulfide isomerase/thioredoxin